MKWLLLALASGFTYGATLRGHVEGESERSLSGAKIVVTHELSMVLVQRVTSDRNGIYQTSLPPGPYRVIVLKKGYLPAIESVILAAERSVIDLKHVLESEMTLGNNRDLTEIKHILRNSNREPHKDLMSPIPARELLASLTPQDTSLQGSLATRTLPGFSGSAGYVSEFAMTTEVKGVRINTAVTRQSGRQLQESLEVNTDVTVPVRNWSLMVGAGNIESANKSLDAGTQSLRVVTQHTGLVDLTTEYSFQESRTAEQKEQAYALSQSVRHRISDSEMNHQFEARSWDQAHDDLWMLQYGADWKSQREPSLSMKAGVEYADSVNQQVSRSQLHVRHQSALGDRWTLSAQLGVTDRADFQHDYQAAARLGSISFFGGFADQQHLTAVTEQDIYGDYLENNLTPFQVESLIDRSVKETTAGLELPLVSSWRSQVSWSHRDEQSMLISGDVLEYDQAASIKSQTWQCSIAEPHLDRELKLEFSDLEGSDMSFRQQTLSYRQNLLPFGRNQVHFAFELSAARQPRVPMWWLLNETPWDPSAASTYYEGHVRMLF